MLQAYMDESGIQDGAHACVIAGYWAGENNWRRFEDRWSGILDDAGMREFHSSEFWNSQGKRKGIYQSWSDDDEDRFISALVDCITDYPLYPTGATLKIAAWKKLNKHARMFLTGARCEDDGKWITFGAPNKTYFLPFQTAILTPAIACKDHLKVHYAFDLHKQFKHYALELFDLIKNDSNVECRHRMGEISFPDSKDAPGLQAADLLAYKVYQLNRIRVLQDEPVDASDMDKTLQDLVKNDDHEKNRSFPYFDELSIDTILSRQMPASLREGI